MFNCLKIQRLVIFTLVFLIIFSFLFPIFAALAGDTSPNFDEQTREPFKYRLMVPLPTASGTVATTTGIVDYIKTLYLFGMGIAGVIAMAMIIVGGFQWMGGGSITSTKAAKSRISNAVLGLVLLLAAYLILNTINPALVNLKEPYVYFMEWYKDFPDKGSTGTGPGDLKSQLEEDCANGDQCACVRLDSNKGGNYGELTDCWDYPAGIAYCENDPCGASTYGCYNTAGSCDTFDDLCTQPAYSHTCDNGYGKFPDPRAQEVGCKTDPCGWGISCTWGTVLPHLDQCY